MRNALLDSIDDYLVSCKERGEEPYRPVSGQFVVRVDPGLHEAVVSAARRAGVSFDKWVTRTLERAAIGAGH